MGNKAIVGFMVLFTIILGWVVFAHADNSTIPTAIADAGVADAKAHMDLDNQGIASDQAQIPLLQSDLTARQQAILALATQSTPLQSAVDLCNSNPSAYCPGWNTPPSSTNVNWDLVAQQNNQGVNWTDIKLYQQSINWDAIQLLNISNGLNWSTINKQGINWNDWPNQEAQGVNWWQWIINGGK